MNEWENDRANRGRMLNMNCAHTGYWEDQTVWGMSQTINGHVDNLILKKYLKN